MGLITTFALAALLLLTFFLSASAAGVGFLPLFPGFPGVAVLAGVAVCFGMLVLALVLGFVFGREWE